MFTSYEEQQNFAFMKDQRAVKKRSQKTGERKRMEEGR